MTESTFSTYLLERTGRPTISETTYSSSEYFLTSYNIVSSDQRFTRPSLNGWNILITWVLLILSSIAIFVNSWSLKRAVTSFGYQKIVGFVRTFSSALDVKKDHTHRRILEQASHKFNINIDLIPTSATINKIIKTRGPFAWDMYGPTHPLAQESLTQYLRKMTWRKFLRHFFGLVKNSIGIQSRGNILK